MNVAVTKQTRIRSPKSPEPESSMWSNCKKVGNQVFISGLVALDGGGNLVGGNDPYAQCCFVFEQIKGLIEASGGTMNDVVKINAYITDMRNRPDFLRARKNFFSGDFPCSTLVGVASLLDPRLLIEIEAIGFIGSGAH